MNTIYNFCHHARYFWITIRIIFILLLLAAISEEIGFEDLPATVVSLFFLVYTLAMITLSILEFIRQKAPLALRVYIGIITLLFGFFLFFFCGDQEYAEFGYAIVSLYFLYGIWEILYGIASTKITQNQLPETEL